MFESNYDPSALLSNPALVDSSVSQALVVADERGRLARMYRSLVDFVLRRKARDVAVSSSRIYVPSKSGFTNTRVANFSNLNERLAMAQGIRAVDKLVVDGKYDAFLMIGGSNRSKRGELYKEGKHFIHSINPATKEVVGSATLANRGELEDAIDCAFDAKKGWASTSIDKRCDLVDKIGDKINDRRDYYAGLMIREVGKNWREAISDVEEAIDFCHYYANQMRRLGSSENSLNQFVLGEENRSKYIARGVVGVISPFNFPLAILVGMTAAALVTGNSVVVKPSPNAPIIAHEFSVLADSLLPKGVLNYVLCDNDDVEVIVDSSKVNTIAFTGSSSVGSSIFAAISQFGSDQHHFKNAVIETGGKNGIIIDSSADLDEAVLGVRHSAFGFSSQKCSASSRVIVVGDDSDFVPRLIESTRSLNVGDPSLPHVDMGPVASLDSYNKIKELYKQGLREGAKKLLEPKFDINDGFYITPGILEFDYSNVLAHQEVFGPILGVMRVKNFDEAVEMMNDTKFALTAGIYSRTPSNIERFKDEVVAGNMYINRPCTGAVVERQPFGGFRMSGVGTKAGGVNYLMNFLYQVSISEEGARRGHVPGIVEYVDGLD
jgi:RHH-type proline utilization regulon transcriptional repressor/proline dehydrogenase/delta 1-pyrroline-5-carboxylate dehydrogenase